MVVGATINIDQADETALDSLHDLLALGDLVAHDTVHGRFFHRCGIPKQLCSIQESLRLLETGLWSVKEDGEIKGQVVWMTGVINMSTAVAGIAAVSRARFASR